MHVRIKHRDQVSISENKAVKFIHHSDGVCSVSHVPLGDRVESQMTLQRAAATLNYTESVCLCFHVRVCVFRLL